MTSPNLDSATKVGPHVNIPLEYLLKGLKGRLDGMLSHYLSNRVLLLDEEVQRKLALKRKFDDTYMENSGFCQGLVEEAEDLDTESITMQNYLFISNERTTGYIH